MKIIVTQEHINMGTRNTCYYCPIALATKTAGVPCVVFETYLRRFNEEKTYELPSKVKNFIRAYDAGKDVKPFEFNLNFRPVSS